MMKSMKSTRLRTAQPGLDNLAKNLERDIASDITHIQDIDINKDPQQRAPALDLSTVATTAPPEISAPNPPTRIFGLQDAPTYYPTEKEFLEPLKYIESIRADAEQAGICKIIPPKGWKPPFSLDTEVKHKNTPSTCPPSYPTHQTSSSPILVAALVVVGISTRLLGQKVPYMSKRTLTRTAHTTIVLHNHQHIATSCQLSSRPTLFPQEEIISIIRFFLLGHYALISIPTFFCWLFALFFSFLSMCVSHMYAGATTTTKLRQAVMGVYPFYLLCHALDMIWY